MGAFVLKKGRKCLHFLIHPLKHVKYYPFIHSFGGIKNWSLESLGYFSKFSREMEAVVWSQCCSQRARPPPAEGRCAWSVFDGATLEGKFTCDFLFLWWASVLLLFFIVAENKKKKKKKNKNKGVGLPPEIVAVPELAKYWAQRYRLFSRFDDGIKLDRGKAHVSSLTLK